MRDLIRKFERGDALTDKELWEMETKFARAQDALEALNHEEYFLVLKDVRQKLSTLVSYHQARMGRAYQLKTVV